MFNANSSKNRVHTLINNYDQYIHHHLFYFITQMLDFMYTIFFFALTKLTKVHAKVKINYTRIECRPSKM